MTLRNSRIRDIRDAYFDNAVQMCYTLKYANHYPRGQELYYTRGAQSVPPMVDTTPRYRKSSKLLERNKELER